MPGRRHFTPSCVRVRSIFAFRMTELEQYIKAGFGVNDRDMAAISSLFEPALLKKGDYFLKAGRTCDKLSFVQSGLLRVYSIADGKEVTQWIATKGYFITDLSSLILGATSRWTIQALTDTELHTIGKPAYDRIGEKVAQWPEMERRFIVQCFALMENRIFCHLSMKAEERYEFFFNQHKELFNQVPLQYIASMLGMTPETFSRIRKKQLS